MPNSFTRKGRPTVITEGTLRKIEHAFALGANIRESCYIANIAESTYYDYVARNPEFLETIERIKDINVVYANRVIIRALNELPVPDAVELAWRILKRKDALQGKLCAHCHKEWVKDLDSRNHTSSC